jgi:hypothetical protein
MKTIKLTESDIQHIVKRVLKEQIGIGYRSLTKLLGRETVENLSKKYSDDTIKSLDNLFAKAAGKNIGSKGSQTVIKSLSGKEVEVGVLEGIIQSKLAGATDKQISDMLILLPRVLADGVTEFRMLFGKHLKSLKPKSLKPKSPDPQTMSTPPQTINRKIYTTRQPTR